MNPPVEVSVLIPFFNAEPFLAVQLEALSRQTYAGPAEFIFSDNGSTDGGRALVESWLPRLRHPARIVDSSGKRGVSHARNTAARDAVGTYIVCCDADDRADPGWLEGLVRTAVEEKADLVSGTSRRWDGRPPASQAPLSNSADYPHLGRLPIMSGGNMLIRRDLLIRLGGWDEDWLYSEDAVLSWRALQKGFRIVPSYGALMDFRHRPTLAGAFRQRFSYSRYNVRLLRHFPAPEQPAKSSAARRTPAQLLVLLFRRLLTPGGMHSLLIQLAELAGSRMGRIAGKIRYR